MEYIYPAISQSSNSNYPGGHRFIRVYKYSNPTVKLCSSSMKRRYVRQKKHVLEIPASGIWSYWKNNSLLIYVTRVSIRTNPQCSCFSLPFFSLNAHASKEKGLYEEEDGCRCSFKTPGCHIIFFQAVFWLIMTILRMKRQRWWITRSGRWSWRSPWDWTLKRRRSPRAWHISKRKTLNSLHALVNTPK